MWRQQVLFIYLINRHVHHDLCTVFVQRGYEFTNEPNIFRGIANRDAVCCIIGQYDGFWLRPGCAGMAVCTTVIFPGRHLKDKTFLRTSCWNLVRCSDAATRWYARVDLLKNNPSCRRYNPVHVPQVTFFRSIEVLRPGRMKRRHIKKNIEVQLLATLNNKLEVNSCSERDVAQFFESLRHLSVRHRAWDRRSERVSTFPFASFIRCRPLVIFSWQPDHSLHFRFSQFVCRIHTHTPDETPYSFV